jgi:xanthine dehydrogenase accessory factor
MVLLSHSKIVIMDIWKYIQKELQSGAKVMLMVAVDLKGSTPGRRGFKMAVSGNGGLYGSVGGGVMEYNMVNMARDMLKYENLEPIVVRQVHNPNAVKDRSGLLCSGVQINLLYPLEGVHLEIMDAIVNACENGETGTLDLQPGFVGFDPGSNEKLAISWQMQSDSEWFYSESIGHKPVFYIFGGGHLSLPLSQVMRMLGFKVFVYDNRPDLNTMENNIFAHFKEIIDYERAAQLVNPGEHSYVAIMTVSHEEDQNILRQMLPLQLKYLGMIGSKRKVDKIFEALRHTGANAEQLAMVDSPMGIDIESQTVEEISISIAAKVIKTKNQ